MGNDGGSIPDRRDLVRNKPKAEQADKNSQLIARWFFCALSKRPLQEPIVSCALGKLYNKDAVLEYLLDKHAYGDGAEICGHIRSLKDVKTLQLTPNPTPSPSTTPEPGAPPRAHFVCPLSQKEMSGGVPFVYLATCGHVFSAGGLKALAPPPGEAALCPQCQTKYTPGSASGDVRMINPSAEEEAILRDNLPAPTTKKKRKKVELEGQTDGGVEGEPESKKAKTKAKPHGAVVNANVAIGARKALAVAEAEANAAKATLSPALKSLYTSRDGPQPKETFLTKGTFTRRSRVGIA
ncbi:DUF602-domain-containing protein [Exidia glandulosa HHB12029]|uniref:DUF602-domain-containing protein n=1 Tax=Exidia glandulosa HHB12029 TaxID=1314781 RepID=A0A165B5I8_EXIGL|nr:DUF602-domain-containing protein [Exidia glandulosa HHB12029]